MKYLLLPLIHVILAHGDDGEFHKHAPLDIDNDHHSDTMEELSRKKVNDMTPEEKEFFYFKQHDYDNDDHLDGIELIQSMVKYEKMDIEDRGGRTDGYPMMSEEQWQVDKIDRIFVTIRSPY